MCVPRSDCAYDRSEKCLRGPQQYCWYCLRKAGQCTAVTACGVDVAAMRNAGKCTVVAACRVDGAAQWLWVPFEERTATHGRCCM